MSGGDWRNKQAAAEYVNRRDYTCALVKNRRRKNRENQRRTKERNETFRKYMISNPGVNSASDVKAALDRIRELDNKPAAKDQIANLINSTRTFLSTQFTGLYGSKDKSLEDELSSAATEYNNALDAFTENLKRIEDLLQSKAVPLLERYANHVGMQAKIGGGWQSRAERIRGLVNELAKEFYRPFKRDKGGQSQPFKQTLSNRLAAIFKDHDIPIKQPTRSPGRKNVAQKVSEIVAKDLKFKTFDLAELKRRSTK